MSLRLSVVSVSLVVALGCGGGSEAPVDSGGIDSGAVDAGEVAIDSGPIDSGAIDAGAADSGAVESCGNAADDDGDTLIDCADPDCGEHHCVAAVPAGWIGPVAVYAGAPSGDPAGCPAPFDGPGSRVLHGDLSAPAATCSACACGGPSGQTCVPPTTITVADAACGAAGTCTAPLPLPTGSACSSSGGALPGGSTTCGPGGGGTCTAGSSPCNVSVSAPAATVTGGSCAPSGGAATLPEPTWGTLGRVCLAPTAGGGCPGDALCIPRAATGFAGACVYRDGDHACEGAFTERHLLYSGLEDTRACTDCACGAPSGSTCSVTIDLYRDATADTCVTHVAALTAGGCTNLTANPTIAGRRTTAGAPTGGSCAPSGGAPTGGVTGTGPVTVCCVP